MKSYYRVILGKKSVYADTCFQGGFIGADFDIRQDLSPDLPDDWRLFNRRFIPVYQGIRPEKSKVAAGLACGLLWTVCKKIRIGDVVLSPDGAGRYRVGEVTGDYRYVAAGPLPHRRSVRWLNALIERVDMSEPLRSSTGSSGTVCDISSHRDELEQLLGGGAPAHGQAESTSEDPTVFALEKHLEDFLVANWSQTELAKDYDIFEEDGERVGQQYPTDTGPLDILAISKDRKTLLVIELKKGRASDAVVGQILRYMGFVQQELAEPGQITRGIIIALEDDQRIRRALAVIPTIDFFRYQISFKLMKA